MTSVSVKDLSLNFGNISVLKDLNLEIADGEFLVLLGPSGCGKSTLLNCIAGLLDISDGQIFIKGKNVTWEEPKDRGIGMVFQSYALYPQMTVKGNLTFGLKNAGVANDEIERRVVRTADILQIQPLLERKPSQLSGGQRQRVAIGRALVRDVDVFLFDEPLSNLDAKLRSELRVEIKRLHQKLANTMIYVTHDQIEALTLADRIAVMKGGLIQQLDTPHAIYNHPVNRFVAGFIGSPGMNFLDGELEVGVSAVVKIGEMPVPVDRYTFNGSGRRTGPTVLGIRPEHIAFGDSAGAMPFSHEVDVEIVEPMGSDTLVWTRLDGQNLSFRVDAERPLQTGDRVRIGFDPARASLFDSATGNRI
ncbi:ABC transporter ATP-binding protein [Allomesorhizobium camelthorni]|uniref:Sn-glycerol-3-phosphate ABC transporter ATP-binding protein UgpC n=1 Tax=Allomesorhizobium camelthorni TaxID=475069 RepID=A0A6G4WJ06_9HYPH|nr:sn-glycerol-3-phosphate ABC transporter ATP-binding protein UgpC [Mesorhizobium camelthorni]NGO54741.1 sn-glycerol-3-phosphate ABC transporter ATP-binding protein UgpC [Mesorhizobium camelthorni]